MTMWPDNNTDLPVEIGAAFGADVAADSSTWAWTDLSTRLLEDEPIALKAGRSGGASQVSPGSCTVTLDNTDSALTPLHPLSPFWPNVELGTPIRVRLRRAEDDFGRTVSNGLGTSTSGQPWTVVSGVASAWSVSSGLGRCSISAVNSYRRVLLDATLLDAERRASITPSVALTGASLVWRAVFRYVDAANHYGLSVELDRNSGSGLTVTCKIRCVSTAGGTVELAIASPVPGVLYTAGQPVHTRAAVSGSRLSVKAWVGTLANEPAGWSVEVDDDTFAAPGRVGEDCYLAAGNTNTLPYTATIDNYALYVDRFGGFADQWDATITPTSDGDSLSTVSITAAGLLRRLTQGTQPKLSPLQRTISGNSPAAYYPVEDGAAAGQAGSAIAVHPPMTVRGIGEFKALDDFVFAGEIQTRYGMSALANLTNGGSLFAALPPEVATATATAWAVHVVAGVDYSTISDDITILQWNTPGGTYVTWSLIISTGSATRVYATNAAGTVFSMIDHPSSSIGVTTYTVTAVQDGADVILTLYRDGFVDDTLDTTPATLTGITSIAANPTGVTSTIQMPLGHIAVFASDTVPFRTIVETDDAYDGRVESAIVSWFNEVATDRLARVAAEANVDMDIPAVPAEAITRMGWQPAGTLVNLMTPCADADGGILYERGFGLGYLPRVYRYNPPVMLTVDLSTYYADRSGLDSVLLPAYDDQDVINQWTIERTEGSSATYSDPAHQRRGARPDSKELLLADDLTLMDRAAWETHLSTVVELREDSIPIDLAGNPGLIDAWLCCGFGSRIQRINPPSQYPGPSDRLVDGWTETLGKSSWKVTITPAPASPWDVGTVDGDQRVAADGSTVASTLALGAMSLSLASTAANGLWVTGTTITNPTDFPMDIKVGGERVTLSGISGTSSPQTATISARGVNGVTRQWDAGTPVDVWSPAIVSL
jgi:hypothetical protein